MKKLLIASSLLVSGSVMAEGFYVGGQAGMSADTSKVESYYSANNKVEHENLGKNAFGGGVFAGYSMDLDGTSVALEVDYLLGDAKTESKKTEPAGNTLETSLKRKDSYSVSALAGVSLTNDLTLYGRLGYTQSKFNVEQKLNTTVQYDDSKSVGGLTLGIGASYQLDQNLSVRADYRYVDYGKVKVDAKSTAGFTKEFEADPSQQVFLVGVQYSF